MGASKRTLVTSALPYANGPLHIGHLAGAYLNADVYVRWLRGTGQEVLFVCGSDEHGAAITVRARKEGLTPQEIVDKYHTLFQSTFQAIGISFDVYDRTSSPLHHRTSQEFFRKLFDDGQFIEKESEQYFDEEANSFLADRYIIGTCPRCGHPDAYGDQCEKCGSTLSPTELIDPRSTLSGSKPVMRSTRHWYLPLENHEAWLREWINTGELDGSPHHDPALWKNHVIGQCKSWLDAGLQPRAMTRDLDWGVDVPPEIPGAAGKKLYVWMDAPIGYISATRKWAEENGGDWRQWWQDEDTDLIHFIGKDNIVFHCLIFPAILKAHGGYNLPVNVPANQFMNLEGNKISTSRNWAVWVDEFVRDFPGLEDSLRYNMIRNMPEQRDSEFTWKSFQETHNGELVNNLANFVNRVLVLTGKYFQGTVPAVHLDATFKDPEGHQTTVSDWLRKMADQIGEIDASIRSFSFRDGLQKVMEMSSAGNQILQINEPWKVYQSDPEAVKPVLFISLQIVTALSRVLRPFLPFTANRLDTFLGCPTGGEKGRIQEILDLIQAGEAILPAGHQTGEVGHLFDRIGDEVIEEQIARLHATEVPIAEEETSESHAFAPEKPEIQYDQFAGLDIRTGTIRSAEKVAKADRLLKLEVDLGFDQRTIVSGIAEYFQPEAIIGQQVLVLANLAPRKLKGITSQGMILMATGPDGGLHFVLPGETLPPGCIIS
ncbi:MAG: methionine--tRNA ligase [Saprospiraceae bacterium]|nr:methionine--tRNA ligase [Saprospiraceae bacterium]